ncbi:acyltransferase family protein [Aureimonas jatrophae]|uniref:Peptidoglycan/LPS O-acetylase OafA/YrhL, contains acyltransferase and SGNH-hydrolase domains n=1 Tax=Aureimonas jatrophae TaxID=1166073 RepID=A0A1H0NLF4_9HYPH|nr:acyltransferase [Aureimonas jatrophae]MBB3951167.1 peptidoglycan/LPS O-acetylase OafA/YrhL [Aureimonas jatrophae]SDO93426.1 Peptidoglycan/LPS O-acetylase OafA/YrhL, contains acyltransferase and SGNH-hydrolase domains [Aureimonas jatrophae]
MSSPDVGGSALTLERKMRLAENRPAGFDYMRLGLAAAVILQHTINVSYGQSAAVAFFSTPARGIAALILPMFFALSGFLVAGSLVRSATLISFGGLRILRIVPALAVEVTLSALLLGPYFTALPLSEYFSSPIFYAYFLNIIGEIHFVLPGVFLDNPVPSTVNGQLWTIPYELKCYVILAALALFGACTRRGLLLIALFVGQVAMLLWAMIADPAWTPIVPGMILVASFLAGILLFQFRARVAWSPALFAVALIATVALLLIPKGDYLVALPLAYVTAFLGLCHPPRLKLLLSGDYSYGLFLYGFPIQQAVAALLGDHQNWLLNFLLTMPFAIAIAVFSWWCVEKPSLKAKPALVRFESWVCRLLPSRLARLITPDGISVLWAPPTRDPRHPPEITDFRGYVPDLQLQRTRLGDLKTRLRAIMS